MVTRACLLLVVCALPAAAAADASVRDANALARDQCDYEKGPFETGRRDPALEKLGERLKMSFVEATARHVLYTRRWWAPEPGRAGGDCKSGGGSAKNPDA